MRISPINFKSGDDYYRRLYIERYGEDLNGDYVDLHHNEIFPSSPKKDTFNKTQKSSKPPENDSDSDSKNIDWADL